MDDRIAGGEPEVSSPPRPTVEMGFPFRPVLRFFLILIPAYIIVFWAVEYWRTRQGPWTLGFATDNTGIPSLYIAHPVYAPTGVELRFTEEHQGSSATRTNIVLNRPMQALPWGQRISEDLMALPGVETLNLFGHEIELAPRVLVLNRKEVPWGSQSLITPHSSEKLPPDPKPKSKYR